MKVRSAIKRICGYCQVIRRGKKIMVRCQKNKRHKQRQGFATVDFGRFKVGDPSHCECIATNGPVEYVEKDKEKEKKVEDILNDLNRMI